MDWMSAQQRRPGLYGSVRKISLSFTPTMGGRRGVPGDDAIGASASSMAAIYKGENAPFAEPVLPERSAAETGARKRRR
jgi:hypothetical protein